jgi:uncharacterized membrane protein
MADTPEDQTEPANATQANEGAERDSLVHRTELIISSVLRGGVLLSAAVIAFGVLLFYLRGSPVFIYPSGRRFPTSLPGVWYGLAHGDPRAIVALGLVLLLATPVVRVAVSIIAFAVSRDRLYVAITALVLAILIFSFLSGLGGG